MLSDDEMLVYLFRRAMILMLLSRSLVAFRRSLRNRFCLPSCGISSADVPHLIRAVHASALIMSARRGARRTVLDRSFVRRGKHTRSIESHIVRADRSLSTIAYLCNHSQHGAQHSLP